MDDIQSLPTVEDQEEKIEKTEHNDVGVVSYLNNNQPPLRQKIITRNVGNFKNRGPR